MGLGVGGVGGASIPTPFPLLAVDFIDLSGSATCYKRPPVQESVREEVNPKSSYKMHRRSCTLKTQYLVDLKGKFSTLCIILEQKFPIP